MTIWLPVGPCPARVAAVIAVCAAALSLRYGGGLEALKAAASQAAAAPSNSLEILEVRSSFFVIVGADEFVMYLSPYDFGAERRANHIVEI